MRRKPRAPVPKESGAMISLIAAWTPLLQPPVGTAFDQATPSGAVCGHAPQTSERRVPKESGAITNPGHAPQTASTGSEGIRCRKKLKTAASKPD
jgi:hypothetical protein